MAGLGSIAKLAMTPVNFKMVQRLMSNLRKGRVALSILRGKGPSLVAAF